MIDKNNALNIASFLLGIAVCMLISSSHVVFSKNGMSVISNITSIYDQTVTIQQQNFNRRGAVYYKVNGDEVIIENTANDKAKLKSFCDDANAIVGGGL